MGESAHACTDLRETLILEQRVDRDGAGGAYISVREEYQGVVGMCSGDEQYTHVRTRLDARLSCFLCCTL